MPRMDALKTKITNLNKNREAWQEWVNTRQALLDKVSNTLKSHHNQGQGLMAQGSDYSSGSGGDIDGEEVPAVLAEVWEAQRLEMRREIASLRRQLETERTVKNDLFERLLKEQHARWAGPARQHCIRQLP